MLVWVDDWQQQCCGDPFSVGSRVTWQLHPVTDRAWLARALGDDLAATVTHAEDHHDLHPATGPATTAVVTRVRAASCSYASDPTSHDPRVHAPVAGTSVVTDVHEADAWFEPPEPLQLNGFLVDLQPVAG